MNYLFSLLCEEEVDGLLELSISIPQRSNDLAQIGEAQVLQRRDLRGVDLLVHVELFARFLLFLFFLEGLLDFWNLPFQVFSH